MQSVVRVDLDGRVLGKVVMGQRIHRLFARPFVFIHIIKLEEQGVNVDHITLSQQDK